MILRSLAAVVARLQKNNLNHSPHYFLCQYLSAALNCRPLPIFHSSSSRCFLSCWRLQKIRSQSPFRVARLAVGQMSSKLSINPLPKASWVTSCHWGLLGDYGLLWYSWTGSYKERPTCLNLLKTCVKLSLELLFGAFLSN